MKNKSLERLGLVAATLSTIAFVPQVWDVWSKRPAPATAISLPMYVIFNAATVLWIVYGIGAKSRPVWIANVIVLTLSLSILIYKIIYG